MTEERWNLSTAPGVGSISSFDLLIIVIVAVAVIGCDFVLRKLSQPVEPEDRRLSFVARDGRTGGGSRIPVTRARELVSVLGTQVLPAVSAGLLVYVHMGDPREALLVFLAIFAGCWSV